MALAHQVRAHHMMMALLSLNQGHNWITGAQSHKPILSDLQQH